MLHILAGPFQDVSVDPLRWYDICCSDRLGTKALQQIHSVTEHSIYFKLRVNIQSGLF